jgi:hypothetical protein
MKKALYILSRFLFGLYILWIGIRGINDVTQTQQHVLKSFEALERLHKDIHTDLLEGTGYHIPINFEFLRSNSAEIVYFVNILFIMGGLLAAFGKRLGRTFIVIGLLIDLLLIHNIVYFAEEKMKVNVLKILSILGGALHIV